MYWMNGLKLRVYMVIVIDLISMEQKLSVCKAGVRNWKLSLKQLCRG